jgi:pSer/pThr/pTyr-binding forkhead associated (FHA) protein
MARLILSLDGQTLAEYNMTKERYTVGRLPDNDIRIDNAAVSGHHSLIINILNDSFLEDLNSTNGTYVNGKLIKKHALQHDDVITVGHHQLRYVEDQADDDAEDEFEKTMVIEPSGQMEKRVVQAAKAARRLPQAQRQTGGEGASVEAEPTQEGVLSDLDPGHR